MNSKIISTESKIKKLIPAMTILVSFWSLAIVLWLISGKTFWLLNFGYIGFSVGFGMGLYAVLPKKKKPFGRKLAQFLVGIYLIGFLGFVNKENMQIEGFFFYLFIGFFGSTVIHYMVAKIFGPLIWGRGWCSWACWTAMILNMLPFKKSVGRLSPKWGNLRYVVFLLSASLVFSLIYFFNYRLQMHDSASIYWLVGGNVLYYSVAIGLAFALKDNRAFCKYVCPVTIPLKLGARFSLIKISGNKELCTDCQACEKVCQMNVKITDYIKQDKRVLSTECIFCQTCINTCSKGALRSSIGFDGGFEEFIVKHNPQNVLQVN